SGPSLKVPHDINQEMKSATFPKRGLSCYRPSPVEWKRHDCVVCANLACPEAQNAYVWLRLICRPSAELAGGSWQHYRQIDSYRLGRCRHTAGTGYGELRGHTRCQ